MVYGLSNGHVTDDVTLKCQTRDPNTLRAQYLENYFRYFKFGVQLCIRNASRRTDSFP